MEISRAQRPRLCQRKEVRPGRAPENVMRNLRNKEGLLCPSVIYLSFLLLNFRLLADSLFSVQFLGGTAFSRANFREMVLTPNAIPL